VGTSTSEVIERLDALARALDPERFSARVVRGYALPFLRVINLEAPTLAERITVRPDESGAPSYWWSWNERITAVDDVGCAARKITTALSLAKPVCGTSGEGCA
jgi:hypothetical protein